MYYFAVIYSHFRGKTTWFVVFYVYVWDYTCPHVVINFPKCLPEVALIIKFVQTIMTTLIMVALYSNLDGGGPKQTNSL